MKIKNWHKFSLAALLTVSSLAAGYAPVAMARGGGGGGGHVGGGGGFGGFGGGGRAGGGDFGGYGGGFGRGDYGRDMGRDLGGMGGRGGDFGGLGGRDSGPVSTGAGGNWGTGGGSRAGSDAGLGNGVTNYGGGAGKVSDNGFGLDHYANNGFQNQWSHVDNQWSHVNNAWSHDNNEWSNVHNEWNTGRNEWGNLDGLPLANRGNYVRDGFNRWDQWYGNNWWNRYPGAWWDGAWGMGDYWGGVGWDDFGDDLGYSSGSDPDYYDYGGSITTNNNNVYYNTTPVASVTEYYTQAQTLAAQGPTTKPTKEQDWKPLGVYSLVQGSQTDTNAMFQLAMDKNGDVGGNYYSVLSGQMLPVHGKLDKKNQRVAWTVGTNKEIVYDTGLGNLFANQAPILVHLSKTKTEKWLLVKQHRPPSQSKPAAGEGTSAGG